MTILGAIFLPQNPPERLREVARVADEAGLEELWLWEDSFFNSGVAAAAARWPGPRISGRRGPSVAVRNVVLTAMEIATMARLFGDRALVGVGHGMLDWMAQAGVRVDSPMTLLREHVTALQALLRGETVTTAGRYVNLDRVELAWPPFPAGRVCGGHRSYRRSGCPASSRRAPSWSAARPHDGVRAARQDIGATEHDVVMFLPAATGPVPRSGWPSSSDGTGPTNRAWRATRRDRRRRPPVGRCGRHHGGAPADHRRAGPQRVHPVRGRGGAAPRGLGAD